MLYGNFACLLNSIRTIHFEFVSILNLHTFKQHSDLIFQDM